MTIIIVFFSGELVWRDRVVNISEVINATPHNALTSVFAKVGSLVSISVLLHFTFIFMGIVSQFMRGYTAIELDVYLVDFFLDTLPTYVSLSALFVIIQTLVKNRYVGYFIGIVFIFAWSIFLSAVHWSSTMLEFGNTPGIFYSDISGYGPAVVGTLWFDLYWLLFSVLLILISGFFWPRSVTSSIKEKWKLAHKNFHGTGKKAFVITLAVWILVAGFVYYNTQVLNPYKNSKERELMAVEYEKTYKKYADYPLPVLTEMDFFIDIFPKDRDVFIRAEGVYKNKGTQPIDSVFFNLDQRWDTKINIPGSRLVLNDSIIGFQTYALAEPLLPGEFIDIKIESNYITKGFENGLGNTDILKNGSFFNNFSILPAIGYTERAELSDKNDRKKYGLPPKQRMPELVEPCGDLCMVNYLTDGRADWVDVETIISTSSDQIAVAPGSLVKEWSESDRNYYQYKVDHPSQNFYSFMSARYNVARDKYKDIDVEIYHDPKHSVNVDMMIDAVKRSLAYYEENFGPYYHTQARILEFPRYSNFAQAFPGTMPYSESFGFIVNLEDESDNNVIDAVIAHEMAHQWWAHQECPAKIQGGTMLSESFSEYSSLMVMKEQSDDMKMKQFLKYDFDRYLRGRSSESEKELPLYKVENQQYIHYGKGAVLLYALQDYISRDSVNAALRSFLEEFRYAEPPYPNSLDFLRHLEPRVPDSLNYLVDDWFKKITLYDFRLKEARLTELDNGKFEVEMDIEAHKFYADTLGNQTSATLKEWVDIGVYADSEEEKLIAWERVQMTKENDTYKLVVDKRPVKAAIDPRRMLIERVIKDNVKTLTE
ncbi:MAG TPA: M1 family aminopeptidase, partial [Cryomorphaceae bacterium]|nr:M1 family aminopeptidase [Cryomorphaceae bacterium]